MKKIVNCSKLMLASLLIASTAFSCNGVSGDPIPDPTPAPAPGVVELPKYEGEIKLDRERIGTNQLFEAKYMVPSGGKNVEIQKYYWGWSLADGKFDLIAEGAVNKDGLSSMRVEAGSIAGEETITLQGVYLNLVDRSKIETASISKKITVVKCDVGTSFWGDSEALVRSSAAEKEFIKGDQTLNAVGQSWILRRDKTVRVYSFTNDKLTQVVERRAGVDAKKLLTEVNGILTFGARRWGYSTPVSFDVIEIATGVKTAIDKEKLKDKTYTDPICDDVASGKSEIVAVAKSDKTTMTISNKVSEVGMINTITYTPNVQ